MRLWTEYSTRYCMLIFLEYGKVGHHQFLIVYFAKFASTFEMTKLDNKHYGMLVAIASCPVHFIVLQAWFFLQLAYPFVHLSDTIVLIYYVQSEGFRLVQVHLVMRLNLTHQNEMKTNLGICKYAPIVFLLIASHTHTYSC